MSNEPRIDDSVDGFPSTIYRIYTYRCTSSTSGLRHQRCHIPRVINSKISKRCTTTTYRGSTKTLDRPRTAEVICLSLLRARAALQEAKAAGVRMDHILSLDRSWHFSVGRFLLRDIGKSRYHSCHQMSAYMKVCFSVAGSNNWTTHNISRFISLITMSESQWWNFLLSVSNNLKF